MDQLNMEQEEIYINSCELYKSMQCMTVCEEKIISYRKLFRQFRKLGEYKDSEKYMVKSKEVVKATKKELKEKNYQNAVAHLKRAKSAADYQRVLDKLEEVGDYKDAPKLKAECVAKEKNIRLHISRRSYAIFATVIVIVLAIASLKTSIGKYYGANALMKVNAYETAAKLYDSLEHYKDSSVRFRECEYQVGLKYKDKEEYLNALKAFRKADSRNDSDTLMVEMQKKVLQESEVNDPVIIGDSIYYVLEKQDDKVLLMKKLPIKDVVYSENLATLTWENSDLREWLNTNFLEQHFKEEEVNNIVDNYEDGIGSELVDNRVYILSKSEVSEYSSDVEMACDYDLWLRDVVGNTDNAMFLNTNDVVMTSGYYAASDNFSVRPVFWYSIS